MVHWGTNAGWQPALRFDDGWADRDLGCSGNFLRRSRRDASGTGGGGLAGGVFWFGF